MSRILSRNLLIFTIVVISAACSSKPPPPPVKNYKLEAMQNDVRQISLFIDNWSGFDQHYSRINSLKEYDEVKQRIVTSPEYHQLDGKTQFASKTNQFDAIVKRYEIWVEERRKLIDKMDRFYQSYKDEQHRLFAVYAKPISFGPYEINVSNGYYAMVPDDPDQAYASARYLGLKQLDIIAASRDQPLRLPTLNITDFVVEIRIINRAHDKILRPDGYISHRQSTNSSSGATFLRSYREYLVNFGDDRKNTYQFKRAKGVINKDSENGIRPGEHMIWSYSFNQENHPLETVQKFQISFPKQVFGRSLKFSIPQKVITRPNLPEPFRTGQP